MTKAGLPSIVTRLEAEAKLFDQFIWSEDSRPHHGLLYNQENADLRELLIEAANHIRNSGPPK